MDLEALREIFRDDSDHIGIGVVTKVALAEDFNCLRAQVRLLPEGREIVCEVGFPDQGDITLVQPTDLVVVAVADTGIDEAFVIARFPTKRFPIPLFARTGHTVKYSRTGKKLYLGSDTKVSISRPNKEASQPLVLGTVLSSFAAAVLDALLNAAQIGTSAMGPVFLDPGVRAALVAAKQTYLTEASTNILSQIAFTERGTE